MTTEGRAESSGFCSNLSVCTVCAPSPSDVPDFPFLNQPNKSPKNSLRCANAYVVNPQKVEIKKLMAVISDILFCVLKTTTGCKNLTKTLRAMNEAKCFSQGHPPMPPEGCAVIWRLLLVCQRSPES